MSNLVEKEEKVSWDRMSEDVKDYYITKLLHTVEQGALALSVAYRQAAEVMVNSGDVGQSNRLTS